MADAPDAVFGLPLSPGERLVLVLLWRYASAGDSDPVVWPSALRIAKITGFGERAVRKIYARLQAAGAISRCDRPPSAMTPGKAWRLDPAPSDRGPLGQGHRARADRGTVPERTGSPCPSGQGAERTVPDGTGVPCPSGPPPPAPADRGTMPERPPRIPIEATEESPDEAPPLPGFALQVVPAKRAKSKGAKRVKGTNGCSDEQWAAVLDAYARARELGGMAAQWGQYRDNETNRGHAARIFRDGYSAADLMAVMEHLGQGLRDGTHEAKWTSLEHVARSMGRYLHEAAGPRQAPRERYADRGAVCYPPVDVDPPREVYEAEVEAAFRRAGQWSD